MNRYIYLCVLLTINGCFFFTPDNKTDFSTPYIEIPVEMRAEADLEKYIDGVRPFYSGRKIFIDPGHGGEDRKNKGRNKLVTEADINLYAALALKTFLTRSGAEVIMSRSTDKTVSLLDRSKMANESCADLFISIHHNAPGIAKDDWTNYTSTYYHALETDYEYEPMERDLARFIQRDLSYAMRQSGGLGSFDGTYSDYIIYPKSGFAVLRNTNIPSILIECSFFTNAYEELKLSKKEYNRIQAFGIFKGLSRYLKNSTPRIIPDNSVCNSNSVTLSFGILDSIKINNNSIKVFVDKKPLQDFTINKNILTFTIPYAYTKPVTIKILAQNERSNYSLPFQQTYHFIKPTKE